MINSKICNPRKIDVFITSVDEGSEITERNIFKRKLLVTKHVIHIPFTYLHYCYEIINKTSFNCVNLIKECTAFNINIITFEPNKVSTLVSKDKLDLAKGIMGALDAIFMRRVRY
jgi:hypothetical protein